TADITARDLTVTATGINKVYDATTAATVTLSDNRISGDVFTDSYTSASFADKNVGTGKTVSVSGIAISGTDAGNYNLTNTTATTTADITARNLTVTATGINKVYDATTAATVTLSDNRVAGDVFTTETYSSASFADKNVGTAKTVSVSGIAISGGDASNYTFNTTATTTANITARALTISATGTNKVYDGNTTATVTLSDNRVAGDVFTTETYSSATFADKNVGTAKTVSVSGIAISGGDASNYTFNTTATTTANITARALTISATGINKVYDGNTTATVTLSDNRVAGDVFTTETYSSASFADKNVGTAKTVSVSGIAISGGDASNYTFNTTATTTANITARPLNVTAAGNDRTYDATTTATATFSDNRIAGDVFTYNYTANFSDKNVGTGKTINISGISLVGTDAGNYSLASTPASSTANITAYTLVVTATGNNKVYDGTTTATVTLADNRTGAMLSDNLNKAYTSATFTTGKNVGTAKPISVSGITISGTDASNYALANTTATATANITARPITVTATTNTKTYDGNITAAATATITSGTLASGDSATFTETYNNKNAGTGKTLIPTGSVTDGNSGANYQITFVNNTTGIINPRSLTVSATGQDKVYDGTTTATVTLSDDRIAGDTVNTTYAAANFNDPTVGTNKPVNVTGIAVSGGIDAGNYTLANTTATTTASITPASLCSGGNICLNSFADVQTYGTLSGGVWTVIAPINILVGGNVINGTSQLVLKAGTTQNGDIIQLTGGMLNVNTLKLYAGTTSYTGNVGSSTTPLLTTVSNLQATTNGSIFLQDVGNLSFTGTGISTGSSPTAQAVITASGRINQSSGANLNTAKAVITAVNGIYLRNSSNNAAIVELYNSSSPANRTSSVLYRSGVDVIISGSNTGGRFRVEAPGHTVTLGNVTSGNNRNVRIIAENIIVSAGATISAGRVAWFEAGNNITLNNNSTILAGTSGLGADDIAYINADDADFVAETDPIENSEWNMSSQENIRFIADNNITTGNNVTMTASGRNLLLQADSITIGNNNSLNAAINMHLNTNNGNLTVGTNGTLFADRKLDINADGNVLLASRLLSENWIEIDADGSITQTAGILKAPTIDLSAKGGINLPGQNLAAEIDLHNSTSGNILVTLGAASTVTGDNDALGGHVTISAPTSSLTIGAFTANSNSTYHANMNFSAAGDLIINGNVRNTDGNISMIANQSIYLNKSLAINRGALNMQAGDTIYVNDAIGAVNSNTTTLQASNAIRFNDSFAAANSTVTVNATNLIEINYGGGIDTGSMSFTANTITMNDRMDADYATLSFNASTLTINDELNINHSTLNLSATGAMNLNYLDASYSTININANSLQLHGVIVANDSTFGLNVTSSATINDEIAITRSSLTLNAATINVNADVAGTDGTITLTSTGAMTINSELGILRGTMNISGSTVTVNSILNINATSTMNVNASGNIVINSAFWLKGSNASNTGTLNLTSSTGAITINAARTTGNNYGHLNVNANTINLNASLTTTKGNQNWNGNLVLGGNISLTAANIQFSSINAPTRQLTLNAETNISATGSVNLGGFILTGGNWVQTGSLPTFTATDFRLTAGTFLRATSGNGNSNTTPWLLNDIFGLQGMATLITKHFKLANNINGTGTANWNSGTGFVPIGTNGTNKNFTGSFNGNGYTISSLTINRAGSDYVGLFGFVGTSGVVSNFTLTISQLMGRDFVGGIAGYNKGTIQNYVVSNDNDITGRDYVGGIAGYNTGTIEDVTSSNNDIYGDDNLGGIAGYNTGTIDDSTSYNNNINGDTNIGGLVGENGTGGTVTDSSSTYNDIITSSISTTGTLIGVNSRNNATYISSDTASNNTINSVSSGLAKVGLQK
ncbi:MAG: YDG domain-containing protein, partial [Gammaproteobacteria bacterium]|nr:YDG domain-containing protein [Gammaproteobacteria bacterium]